MTTAETVTTEYTLHGKLVVHQKVTTAPAGGTPSAQEMHFFYDAQGRPAMVEFCGKLYIYRHNLQGDIVGILDSNGNSVVEYDYDAWGRPTRAWSESDSGLESTLISEYAELKELNPFRYRGYVWDEETGLYYLRSRYYDPVWGRFICGDLVICIVGALISHDMFTYSRNTPISYKDADGFSTIYILYDGRPNTSDGTTGGFGNQANHIAYMHRLMGDTVTLLDYTNMSDDGTEEEQLEDGTIRAKVGFIARWNSIEEDVDVLYVIGHGSPGTIDARGESMTDGGETKTQFSYSRLKKIVVKDSIQLLTCNGATPGTNGVSAAKALSRRAGNVGAFGLYYAKTYWLFNKILIIRRDKARINSAGIPWWKAGSRIEYGNK